MDVIELGGRRVVVLTETTAKHDHWMMAQLIEAGIAHAELEPGESAAHFVDATLDRVILGGHTFTLLGGMLLPDGMTPGQWTPEVAREMATFLEQLTTPDDKARLRGMLAVTLAGFFQSGLASLTTSRTASTVASPRVGGTAQSSAIGGP